MDDRARAPDPLWSDFRQRLGQLRALMPILAQRPTSPHQLQAQVSAAALDLELIVSLLADARDYVEARPRPIPGGAAFAQTVTDVQPALTWMLSALDWLSDTLSDALEKRPAPSDPDSNAALGRAGRARGPETRALPQ